jgi:hypothetical protein
MKTPNVIFIKKEAYRQINTLRRLSEGFIDVAGIIEKNNQSDDEFIRKTVKQVNICGNCIKDTLDNSTTVVPDLGEKTALCGEMENLIYFLKPVSDDFKSRREQKYPQKNILQIVRVISNEFEQKEAEKAQKSIETLQKTIQQTETNPEFKSVFPFLKNIFID